ncbi:Acg family FMN-binding oxidoreductase [Pseudorhodoferax sp.]|uniref:Acg family FMN-binding oxidoreductase n=1 Tax=Pseudorhodoferax sp. TaxID=1993553 RepID=UPI0039E61062
MRYRTLFIGGGAGALLAAAGWRRVTGSMAGYAARAQRLRAPIAAPHLHEAIRLATLAANSHNTQPWRFRLRPGAVEILPDPTRRTPAVDPDDHHLHVSLGCAAQNFAIAAAATGHPGELVPMPGGLRYEYAPGPARRHPLLPAIAQRQSTRTVYDGRPLPAAELALLERAAAWPGVRCVLLADRPRIGRIRDLVVAGNAAQMADAAFLRELRAWLRFNPRHALASGDGLFAATAGRPVLPDALGRLAFEHFFGAAAENARYARQVDSSAGIAVFLAERADPPHWWQLGRACQQFALQATALGLRLAFVNQPVEVPGLRPALAAVAGEPALRPDLVLRFGRGPALPMSLRREVAAVLDDGTGPPG